MAGPPAAELETGSKELRKPQLTTKPHRQTTKIASNKPKSEENQSKIAEARTKKTDIKPQFELLTRNIR